MREYTENFYLPAASAFSDRAADKGTKGMAIINWWKSLEQQWGALRFGDITSETDGKQLAIETQVYFDDFDPESVRVELYADGLYGATPERLEMKRIRQLAGAINGYAYRAVVTAIRPVTDYTARVIPHRDGVAIPLENTRILWQR